MKEEEQLDVDGNVKNIVMGFKMKPPYEIDNTPVYTVKEEEGILGRAQKCGSITINVDVTDPDQKEEILEHEKVHLDQMKDGRLWYDDEYMYHRKSGKGKWSKVKRSSEADGAKSHWWEKEAYKKDSKIKKRRNGKNKRNR